VKYLIFTVMIVLCTSIQSLSSGSEDTVTDMSTNAAAFEPLPNAKAQAEITVQSNFMDSKLGLELASTPEEDFD
jgi:hypothetical protein